MLPHCKKGLFIAFNQSCNLDHSFIKVDAYDEYCDFFCFAAPVNCLNIINFYFHHIDMLEKFCIFFSENAQGIIRKFKGSEVYIPQDERPDDKSPLVNNCCSNQIIFNNRVQSKLFTDREIECILLLKNGLSAKEAAKRMNISHRTVEKHLENIRNKTGYKKITEVLFRAAITKKDL